MTEPKPPATQKYHEREKWSNKLEFIFSSMAFCIGLGKSWEAAESFFF